MQRLLLTSQRKAVLEAVKAVNGHVDAAEVFDCVRQVMPRISLGTVYRALGWLVESGMIHEINQGNGPVLYDGNLHPHQHIVCRDCGKVSDVEIAIPEDLLNQVTKTSGFSKVEGERIYFHGLCPSCSNGKRGN